MSEDIGYILSVFLFLAGGVVLAGAILLIVEGVYRLYCKITGRDY
jgi:hypothetical protein